MAKKQIVEAEMQDDLAGVLADSLNKKFKSSNYKIAYFLDGDEDSPCNVDEFVSSGSTMVDLAISNRPNGGFPVGRITEVTGLEASGKSLLAAHALVSTQKKDGLAVYIDTENAVSREFLEAIGLDLKKMLYIPLETIEDIFESIETIIESVRKSNKDRLVTIVVDSIMGASTKVEMAADYEKDGWATTKAILLSKAMRKITNMIGRERICLIFTNQLRTRLGCINPYESKIIYRKIMYSTEKESMTIDLLNELGICLEKMNVNEPINILSKGYQLLSRNGNWNDIEYLVRKEDAIAWSISFNNDYFECNEDHAILCKDISTNKEEFIKIKDVDLSKYLVFYKSKWITPYIEKLTYKIPIVDFSLNGDHTYENNGFISHNTTFGDPYTTSGGKGVAFHSSVRLRLKSVGQIKLRVDGRDEVMGITTRCTVIKNRLGPPLRNVDYDIFFDSGIDDFGSWLKVLKDYNLVTQAGAWYTYTNTDTGEIIKFQSKDFKSKMIDDPEMKAQVYKSICDKYILNYKAGDSFGIDDVELNTDFEGEES